MELVPKSTFGGQKSALGQQKLTFGAKKLTMGKQNRLLVPQSRLCGTKIASWSPRDFAVPKHGILVPKSKIRGAKIDPDKREIDNMGHERQYDARRGTI